MTLNGGGANASRARPNHARTELAAAAALPGGTAGTPMTAFTSRGLAIISTADHT